MHSVIELERSNERQRKLSFRNKNLGSFMIDHVLEKTPHFILVLSVFRSNLFSPFCLFYGGKITQRHKCASQWAANANKFVTKKNYLFFSVAFRLQCNKTAMMITVLCYMRAAWCFSFECLPWVFYGIALHILNESTRFVRASIKWCIHIHTYTHQEHQTNARTISINK